MPEFYYDDILAELEHLQNVGTLADADLVIGENNASCGDQITWYLKVKKLKGKKVVTEVKWQGQGCSISQVSTSLFSQAMIGKALEDLIKLEQPDMEKMLGLEHISMGRIKCLMLPLTALKNHEK